MKAPIRRPMTSNQLRNKPNFLHDAYEKDYKIVEAFKKEPSNEIKKLKKSVEELETIAVTRYGIDQFKNQVRNS